MNNKMFTITTVFILVLSGMLFLGSEESEATQKSVTVTIVFWYVTILDPVEPWNEWDAEIYFSVKWATAGGSWSGAYTTSSFTCDDAGSQSDHGTRTLVPNGKDTLSKALTIVIADSSSYDYRIYIEVLDDDPGGDDLLDSSPHASRSGIDMIYNTAYNKLKVWESGDYQPVGGNQWSGWQNCGNNMITCSGEGDLVPRAVRRQRHNGQ